MKVHVLFAHPVETSFNAALHGAVVDGLCSAGHEVDDCDLYAEAFQPVLSRDERATYHDTEANREGVRAYVERLEAAEALVMCFPVWNFGFPAILKGYFDRVFLPGVSFDITDGKVSGRLTNIRRLAAVTSYGGPRLAAMLSGDPPRRVVTRVLKRVCGGAATDYLAIYDMNRADDWRRRSFLDRVSRWAGAL